MRQFIGVFQHEFSMSIRRKSLWIGNIIVIGLFVAAMLTPDDKNPNGFFAGNPPWQEAGDLVYMFNMLLPLVAGILSSDRLKRDYQLGLRELQASTAISNAAYLGGKYVGVIASTLLPFLIAVLGLGGYAVISGASTPEIIAGILVAFFVISIPSFIFVVAFSLACPLIIPVRVYQILFTGYWFWGNFLSEKAFPTISGTLLNSSGIYALQGLFFGTLSRTGEPLHTPLEAWLNIIILISCAGAALFILHSYLSWQSRRV